MCARRASLSHVDFGYVTCFFYIRALISARLSLHVRVASSVDTPRRHHRVLIFTLFMHRFRRPPRFPVEVVASFAPSLPPAAL